MMLEDASSRGLHNAASCCRVLWASDNDTRRSSRSNRGNSSNLVGQSGGLALPAVPAGFVLQPYASCLLAAPPCASATAAVRTRPLAMRRASPLLAPLTCDSRSSRCSCQYSDAVAAADTSALAPSSAEALKAPRATPIWRAVGGDSHTAVAGDPHTAAARPAAPVPVHAASATPLVHYNSTRIRSCCKEGIGTVVRLPPARSSLLSCNSTPVVAAATGGSSALGSQQQSSLCMLTEDVGAVSRTVTAPLDRVKVMLQLQPASVPLKHAARAIMQQELSVKAAAASVGASGRNSKSNNSVSAKSLPMSCWKVDRAMQKHVVRMCPPATSANSSSGNNSRLLLGGWRGFFRGNLTNCLKVVPETAIKFYSYDMCKHALVRRKQEQQQDQEPQLQLSDRFVCGAAAGLCAQLLIYPMELVKTRLAAYSPGCMYSGVLQCFTEIYREGGLRRLYRGLGPSLLGIIPYAGIDLAVFETLKEAYLQKIMIPKFQQQQQHALMSLQQQRQALCSSCNSPIQTQIAGNSSPKDLTAVSAIDKQTGGAVGADLAGETSAASSAAAARGRCCCDAGVNSSSGGHPLSPPALVLLLMGGCSSLIGQVLAYPTALVRTRMQVDGSGGQHLLYRSSAAAATAAVRQGGLRGLYRGLGANCCKALPAVSLSWIVYEKTKEVIRTAERDWTEHVARQRATIARA
ncbi:mitochondrial carrier domain-containing protein [Cyclospora cayetanensis]|uniref:Mitochondrial carrier domain-containing protein n=1 Tax=Cyclospora cayetanensis TaxID=88456 RepID=A0A1D3D348_9EIME|nr:mitochondrial carrier domain-containing protein [Cyclospora cayetanensis]